MTNEQEIIRDEEEVMSHNLKQRMCAELMKIHQDGGDT
jgi:hypothetical protein